MELGKLSAKEIENIFAAKQVTEDLLTAAKEDPRKAVQRILSRYEKNVRERMRVASLYTFEEQAEKEGLWPVAGVDEAGRGPLAGPVSVAAVILPPKLFLPKLNDSKKISPKVREELFEEINAKAVAVKSTFIGPEVIDDINIYQAVVKGMYEVIFALDPTPKKVLIDAVKLPKLPMASLSIIGGDGKSASIAAASIVAKVTRDRLMEKYDKEYPQYGFARHKGYGTAEHMAAIKKYGLSPIHRRSFAPMSDTVR